MAKVRYVGLVRNDSVVDGRQVTYIDAANASITEDQQVIEIQGIAQRDQKRSALGIMRANGSIAGVADSNTLGHVLMGTLGGVHSVDRVVEDTLPMEHIFFGEDSIPSYNIVVGKEKQETCYYLCYFNSLTLEFVSGEVITWSADVLGSGQLEVTGTPLPVGAGTGRTHFVDDDSPLFVFHQADLRLTNSNGDQYEIDPTAFRLTIENNLTEQGTLGSRFLGRSRIFDQAESIWTEESAGTPTVSVESSLYRLGSNCGKGVWDNAGDDDTSAYLALSALEDWSKYTHIGFWYMRDDTTPGADEAEDPTLQIFDTSVTFSAINGNTVKTLDHTDLTKNRWWWITGVINGGLDETTVGGVNLRANAVIAADWTAYWDSVVIWNNNLVQPQRRAVTGSFDMVFDDVQGYEQFKHFYGAYDATSPADTFGGLKMRLICDTGELIEALEAPTHKLIVDFPKVEFNTITADESSRDQIVVTVNWTAYRQDTADADSVYDDAWDNDADFDTAHGEADINIPGRWDIMINLLNDKLDTMNGTEQY